MNVFCGEQAVITPFDIEKIGEDSYIEKFISTLSKYDEVKNEIEKSLMYQKQSEAYSKELNNLKSKYSNAIKYNA